MHDARHVIYHYVDTRCLSSTASYLLALSPSTIRNTRLGGDVPDPSTTFDRPTDRVFALPELITPQIDHLEDSRFWRDLAHQFRMVQGVGPSR